MIVDDEVDLAVNPPLAHALDPFANGHLITRRVGDGVEIVQADPMILLGCGFLWDIVANAEVFAPWCQLIPPVPELGFRANFQLASGVSMLDIVGKGFPTNRPGPGNMHPICQHWTIQITVGSRILGYKIGSYRPSIGVMEATAA